MNCENISVSSCNNPFNDVIGTMSIYEQYKSSHYISLNNVNYEIADLKRIKKVFCYDLKCYLIKSERLICISYFYTVYAMNYCPIEILRRVSLDTGNAQKIKFIT